MPMRPRDAARAFEEGRDKLVPAASSAPLALLNADLERLELNAGHAGLIVGRKAHKEMVPAMLEWLHVHT